MNAFTGPSNGSGSPAVLQPQQTVQGGISPQSGGQQPPQAGQATLQSSTQNQHRAPTIPGVTLVDARSNAAPIILVVADEKAGKCLRGDTKILQTNGTMRTIAELVREQSAEVITMGEAGAFKAATPKRYFENDVKRLFRLTTQTGRSIDATEEHPFLTRDGWVLLKDLVAGRSRVAVAVNYPMREQGSGVRLVSGGGKLERGGSGKRDFAEAWVKIIAYLIADGGIGPGKESCPIFTKNEDLIRDEFAAAVALVGDVPVEFESDSAWNIRVTGGGQRANIATMLEELRLAGCKSGDKFVPERILNLPPHLIRLFLNRLFTCDGSMEEDGQVSYSSKSKILIMQVLHLLTRFGIVGRAREKIVDGVPYYELAVSARDEVIRFIDEIGFFGAKAQKAARLRPEIAAIVSNPTQLDRLGDILFDRVVSVEYVATEPTFDFEIEGTHNFVANDFVVHNSATSATTLVNYPEPGFDPLVLAWDKTGPDACIKLGYQPHAIKIGEQPGTRNWDKARGVLDTLERNASALHGRYGAIITDCMSTMVDRLHEDARRFEKNPDPRSHFGVALMQSKEWINRLVDLGLPTIWLSWLKQPEVQDTVAPGGQKTKKYVMGGPNILGNTRTLIAGKAHHILYLEKVKMGPGTQGADDEGYVRMFHTRPYENINCHGRYSHVLPEPAPAHLGFILGCITGRGPWAPQQPGQSR